MPPVPPTDGWWRTAVMYQVYIRSFGDADGDGVGDIAGIQRHLPHVRDLGADGIWINPWYRSPMVDAGYDISDHRDIDPVFGTLAQAEDLIRDARAMGLRVMVDMVPNHTSDAHPWFQAALAAPPGSPERARFLFRDGAGPDGATPPNDWRSCFGGPAWTREPGAAGQWFLHLFALQQPDLNWDNPEVRDEFLSIMEFWLQRGVDGFRVDVTHGMVKAAGLPDVGYDRLTLGPHEVASPWQVTDHPHWDREGVHEILRSWRRLWERHPDVAFVAEAEVGPERWVRYVRPDEVQTTFNFPFMKAGWHAGALRRVIDDTIDGCRSVGAAPNWVLGNHDVCRVVTRYGGGDDALGVRRARAGALLMLGLPGGAYIYQGDELGLAEVTHFAPGERDDPVFATTGGALTGRDGCRVPLPWSGDAPPYGFSPEGAAPPWLRQPADWGRLTVAHQREDPDSTLNLHRRAIALRRAEADLRDEGFAWCDAPPQVLHFARGADVAVAVNLGEAAFALPRGARVLLASGPLHDGALPPDTAVWFRPE